TVEPLLEAAKAASFEATAHLFEEKKPPALEQQSRVISHLAQIEKVLEQGLDLDRSNRSADELAAEIERLEALKKQLAVVDRQQQQTAAEVEANLQAARDHERLVAEELARSDALGDFPRTVDARLRDAKEKVDNAQR